MKSVCILGLGWLGKQIVDSLSKQDFQVFGVNRSIKSDLTIKQWAFDINSPDAEILNELKAHKFDVLIVTIPPSSSESYTSRLKEFINGVWHSNLNVVYTSSTSMYGSEPRIITEESSIDPSTSNAIKINRFEQYLIENFSSKHAILRLAGLVGLDRHPIKYLSGKTDVRQPKAPVNLVHAEEITSFLLILLGNWHYGVFNLCNPDHPSKESYYSAIANRLGMEVPKFDLEDERLGKKVNSIRLEELKFEFKYNNLDQFPLPTLA